MTAAFLRDKWGWLESGQSWWCNSGRQNGGHPFKECLTWKKEIRALWREVGDISGSRSKSGEAKEDVSRKGRKGFGHMERQARAMPRNTTIRELLAHDKCTEAVVRFLKATKIGNVKDGALAGG